MTLLNKLRKQVQPINSNHNVIEIIDICVQEVKKVGYAGVNKSEIRNQIKYVSNCFDAIAKDKANDLRIGGFQIWFDKTFPQINNLIGIAK